MTDNNGPCYTPKIFREVCATLGVRHIRIRLYTPRINGKAERFIRIALKELVVRTLIRSLRNDATSFQPGFIAVVGIGLTVVSKSRLPLADWYWAGTI